MKFLKGEGLQAGASRAFKIDLDAKTGMVFVVSTADKTFFLLLFLIEDSLSFFFSCGSICHKTSDVAIALHCRTTHVSNPVQRAWLQRNVKKRFFKFDSDRCKVTTLSTLPWKHFLASCVRKLEVVTVTFDVAISRVRFIFPL